MNEENYSTLNSGRKVLLDESVTVNHLEIFDGGMLIFKDFGSGITGKI